MLLSPALEEAVGYWLNECTLPATTTKEVPTPGLQGVLWDIIPTGLYRRIDEHRRAQQDSWSTVLLEALEAFADKIPLKIPRPDPKPSTDTLDAGWTAEHDSGVHLATGT